MLAPHHTFDCVEIKTFKSFLFKLMLVVSMSVFTSMFVIVQIKILMNNISIPINLMQSIVDR